MSPKWILTLIWPACAMASSPFTGSPVAMQERVATFSGVSAVVVTIGANYHPMNVKPGQLQPIGLEQIFSIRKDPSETSESLCEMVYKKVSSDASVAATNGGPIPYLEIDFTDDATPVKSDDGLPVYSEGNVSCWESFDLGPSFYQQ